MKIEIKPVILTAGDYHDFRQFADNASRLIEYRINYSEIEPDQSSYKECYRAIFWPSGAEDELFEFIFTNKEAWDGLTIDPE